MANHGPYGFGFVFVLVVGVEKLAEYVHGVGHSYRHQEDRDHRAHDVNLEAQSDQQAHCAEYADDCQDHGCDDQGYAPEEQEQEKEDYYSCHRRRCRHLHEHLHAERIFSDRETCDVDIFLPILGEFADKISDVVTERLFAYGDVDADGLFIF